MIDSKLLAKTLSLRYLWLMPRPYRMNDYVRLRALRAEAIRRQSNRCYWCDCVMHQTELDQPQYATADHLIPLHDGGKTTHGNIVAACKKCNSERHPELNPSRAGQERKLTIGDDTVHSPFAVLAKNIRT